MVNGYWVRFTAINAKWFIDRQNKCPNVFPFWFIGATFCHTNPIRLALTFSPYLLNRGRRLRSQHQTLKHRNDLVRRKPFLLKTRYGRG